MTKKKESGGYEAECQVLGAIVVDDRVFYEEGVRLSDTDFSDQRNATVYRAIKALVERGVRLARATIVTEIGDSETDYSSYVAALVAGAAETHLVHDLVGVVLHHAGVRRLIDVSDQIRSRAAKSAADGSLDEITQSGINLLASTRSNDGYEATKLHDLCASIILRNEAIAQSGRSPAGILTKLSAFDDLVGPLLPGHVIVIGGETGAGKTALAVTLGYNVAEQGIPVNFTSLEMGNDEIVSRILAARASVSSEDIATGNLSKTELDAIFGAAETMVECPFYFDDQPRQSVPTIYARLARAKAKRGIQLGIIDHLQFVRADNPKAQERERIMQQAEDIKAMAKRLEIPLILLSHVIRYADTERINTVADVRRPMLRDLYGSSAIEKAADVVVFVHRPIWHLERASPNGKSKDQHTLDCIRWRGKAELVMPKRRGGKGFGVATCRFDEEKTWFHDIREEPMEGFL